MKFYQFAWNNLTRSKSRTVLTVLSIIVAAITLCLVLSLDRGYKQAVEDELVKKTGIHIYISREGCPTDAAAVIAQGGISPVYIPEEVVSKIENVEFIETVMPFNIFALTTEDGTRTDIFFGVTEAIQKIRPDWEIVKGGWFKDETDIILGAELARLEKREIGDKVYFEQLDKEFVVSGILKRNNSQDDGIFFLPLKVAQQLIGREKKLSAIAVTLNNLDYLGKVKGDIKSMLPVDYYVIAARELGEAVLKFFGATRAIMMIMVFVTFIMSVFSITNTMMMTVIERRRELAYLKCVGAGYLDIIRLLSSETVIMSSFGATLGIVVGLFSAPVFEDFIRKFLVEYIPMVQIVRPTVGIVILVFLVTVIIGILACLYPAVKAAKTIPMEVLRNE